MKKRFGIPFVALLALLVLIPPQHAQAAISFGFGIGTYPAYPAYGYAAPYGYYDAPAYAYPAPYPAYGYGYAAPYAYGGYYGGWGDHDWGEHGWGERGWGEHGWGGDHGRGWGGEHGFRGGGFRGGRGGFRGGHR